MKLGYSFINLQLDPFVKNTPKLVTYLNYFRLSTYFILNQIMEKNYFFSYRKLNEKVRGKMGNNF